MAHCSFILINNPAGNYMIRVNNRNTITKFEVCLKLTIKNQNDYTGVVLVLPLLTLNIFTLCSNVSNFNFK